MNRRDREKAALNETSVILCTGLQSMGAHMGPGEASTWP